jgi:crossover junction endodeoxyribonuclease RuvC
MSEAAIQKETHVVGVDPGSSGALVVLDAAGAYVAHLMMPVVKVGTKNRVNGAAVASFFTANKPRHVFIELVHAMPKQGVSSTYSFAHAAGLVEGVVTGAGIPFTLITPQAWKKAAGLIGSDKDAARSRAIQLFPHLRVLDLKGKGQAVADALLIARFGMGVLRAEGAVA